MRCFISIIIIFGITSYIYSDNTELVKRSVAVVPFYNMTENNDDNYMAELIGDTLSAYIAGSGQFNLLDNQSVQNQLKSNNIDYDTMIWEDTANLISQKTGVDVVVFGFFTVTGRNITIYINALDGLVRRSAITLSRSGSTGVMLMNTIEVISNEMAESLVRTLPPLEQRVVDKLMVERTVIVEQRIGSFDMDQYIVSYNNILPLLSEREKIIEHYAALDDENKNINDNFIEVFTQDDNIIVYFLTDNKVSGIIFTSIDNQSVNIDNYTENFASNLKTLSGIEPIRDGNYISYTTANNNSYSFSINKVSNKQIITIARYMLKDTDHDISSINSMLNFYPKLEREQRVEIGLGFITGTSLSLRVFNANIYGISEYQDSKSTSQSDFTLYFSLPTVELGFNFNILYYNNSFSSSGTSVSLYYSFNPNLIVASSSINLDTLYRFKYLYDLNTLDFFIFQAGFSCSFYFNMFDVYPVPLTFIHDSWGFMPGVKISVGIARQNINGFSFEIHFYSKFLAGPSFGLLENIEKQWPGQSDQYTGHNMRMDIVPFGIEVKLGGYNIL